MRLRFAKSLAIMSAFGMLLQGFTVTAADDKVIRTTDVILGTQGTLTGAVISPESQRIADATVKIYHEGALVATARTSENGEFAFRGLKKGPHTIQCSETTQNVRFWSGNSAPPSSVSRVAVVVDQSAVVRGQTNGLAAQAVPLGIFGGALAITLATTLGRGDSSTEPVDAFNNGAIPPVSP